MSSRSLSPGFFDPRNYVSESPEVVVVPQNAMKSPSALSTSVFAWFFAAAEPGCQCGGGEKRITKVYTY